MESSNREHGIETIKIEEIQAKLNKGEWVTVHSKAPEDTAALGALLGRTASPGQIYTLTGDLGVGKTVFTQGFAKGLGVAGPVNSPTFTIVQIYEDGRLPFYHLTFTALRMWRRWRRSAMRTASTGTGSA